MMWITLLIGFCCCVRLTIATKTLAKKPHILFFLADDMGWNDVSYHGSPQIPTPNIDALAASGIMMNNYYVEPQCTPSRGSLLTGMYPIRFGLQHYVINSGEPSGLSLNITLLPEYLKKLNYSTHMVGKWHLGYHKRDYVPNHRGFDSFFGYWNGVIDYMDHTNYETVSNPGIGAMWGIDLHDNDELAPQYRGQYATEVFGKRALDIINDHNTSKPLFLYMSNLACHVGNSYMPMQAPPEYVARFQHIKDLKRRTYAGVVSAMDDVLGKLYHALHERKMLDNTILIFSSDNGGLANGSHGGQASNWPLRSMKMHLWEGGVRVPGFIWSPLLELKEPRISTQMMHISDWLPTLYSAAGGDVNDLGEIDGYDMWEHLKTNSESPRDEILLNIDRIYGMSALRQGDWKVVNGTFPDGEDGWYGPSGKEDVTVTSMDDWVWKDGSVVKDILKETKRWLIKTPDQWREGTTVECKNANGRIHKAKCNPKKSPCLFNIKNDPCEYHNLAARYPKKVKAMMNRIQEYSSIEVPSISKPVDSRADPRCHKFSYVNWMEEEYLSECPWL